MGSVLDVACGPGIITVALAARAREVVAFVLTPEMLNKARQRCASAGARNVTFREGSATDLPFADNTFDCAATRLSLHHFENPGRVLDEIRRVLKPGGAFVVADVVSSEIPAKSALQNAIETIRDPSHDVKLQRGNDEQTLTALAPREQHPLQPLLSLLGSDPGALLRDGTFHQQHSEHQRGHDDGQHPEYIEVSERRRLLLAQVRQRL
jgi:SAM-dependent methyltransferase